MESNSTRRAIVFMFVWAWLVGEWFAREYLNLFDQTLIGILSRGKTRLANESPYEFIWVEITDKGKCIVQAKPTNQPTNSMKRQADESDCRATKRIATDGIGLPLEIVSHIVSFLPYKLLSALNFATCCKSHAESYTMLDEHQKRLLIPTLAVSCIGGGYRCGCASLSGKDCPYYTTDTTKRQRALISVHHLCEAYAQLIQAHRRLHVAECEILTAATKVIITNDFTDAFKHRLPLSAILESVTNHLPRLDVAIKLAGSRTHDLLRVARDTLRYQCLGAKRADAEHFLWLCRCHLEPQHFVRHQFIWRQYDFDFPTHLDPRKLIDSKEAADLIENFGNVLRSDNPGWGSSTSIALPKSRYFEAIFQYAAEEHFSRREYIVERLHDLYTKYLALEVSAEMDAEKEQIDIQTRLYMWGLILERLAQTVTISTPFTLKELCGPYRFSSFAMNYTSDAKPKDNDRFNERSLRKQLYPLRRLYQLGWLEIEETKLDSIALFYFKTHVACE